MKPVTVLSLQSGTSADGIDAALVTLGPHSCPGTISLVPVFARTYPLSESLQQDLIDFSTGARIDAGQVCQLHTLVGREFAAAGQAVVREATEAGALAPTNAVDLVVSHGQTVYHWVEHGQVQGSLQLGEAAWIAEALRASVISNVRAADIAAGGQGAPLMELFDRMWLSGRAHIENAPLATVNIGGISNVQLVQPTGEVVSFDTGPGNALMDEFTRELTGHPYDDEGRLAAHGTVHLGLLEHLLAHPYLAALPPKSTGRETFTAEYVRSSMEEAGVTVAADVAIAADAAVADADADAADVITAADLIATLAELTAVSIASQIPEDVTEVIVSGGGALNTYLMRRLQELLADQFTEVVSSEAYLLDPLFKESYMFALLGYLSWHRIPLTLGKHPARIAGQISFFGEADLPPRHTNPLHTIQVNP